MFHIHAFGGAPGIHGPGALAENITTWKRSVDRYPRVLEAVLTDGQERNWSAEMSANGFRKVYRFNNGNTGNNCNVWVLYEGPLQVYDVTDPVPVAMPPLPPPPAAPAVPAAGGNFAPNGNYGAGTRLAVGTRVQLNDPYFGQRNWLIGTVVHHYEDNTIELDIDQGCPAVRRGFVNRYRPAPVEQPVAPPQRREVLVEYFAHLLSDHIKGPFNSRLDAEAGFPRCRQFDRRIFYSDGTFETEQNV